MARKRLWFPLTLGFGSLLILIASATAVTLTRSFEIFGQLSEAHQTHAQVAEALLTLRSDLYLAGILKRDFLLERQPDPKQSYAKQFEDIQKSTEDALRTIERAFHAQRPDAIARLRSEVGVYMQPIQESLDWNSEFAQRKRSSLLRLQLGQRASALQIANQIELLNRQALETQQAQISHAEETFRYTLGLISAAAVLLGIIVSGIAIVYTRNLEQKSDASQNELRQLSQHIVSLQENERKNISRELHDEVGQMLTGLRMELANLEGPGVQNNPSDFHRLQEAKRLAERSLQCVRNISMLLRPSMLDDLGLEPAIQWQAKEFGRRTGIPVDVNMSGPVCDLPEEIRTCVYRVIQEALTNAARHANPTRVWLKMDVTSNCVRTSIEDNGVGFTIQKGSGNGLGLISMRERVEMLGGRISVESSPGKGTNIAIEMPIRGQKLC